MLKPNQIAGACILAVGIILLFSQWDSSPVESNKPELAVHNSSPVSTVTHDETVDVDSSVQTGTPAQSVATSEELVATEEPLVPQESDQGIQVSDNLTEDELADDDINFSLNIESSDYFDLRGRAQSDLGDVAFQSKLSPSNEVNLSLDMLDDAGEPIQLKAYLDLANFTMELDGGNAVLSKDHKVLLDTASAQITSSLIEQYEGYEVPEHGFMLIQMLSYWAASPEGYVHEKHIATSRQ